MIKVYMNGTECSLSMFTFNGGEEYVRIYDAPIYHADSFLIDARIQSSQELMRLLMVVDAIKQNYNVLSLRLHLPYIPYARQDRVCSKGESLSIKVFADILNSMEFDEVMVMMPHSDVSTALINNVKDITQRFEDTAITLLGDQEYSVVSPDGGALKRTFKFAQKCKKEMITADKIRDTSNGQIIRTELYGEVRGKNCVIYDDICDGGMTFIKLAEVLKKCGASKVILVVAHGIFSKGLGVFDGLIDEIITSNSVDFGNRIDDNGNMIKNLTVIKL